MSYSGDGGAWDVTNRGFCHKLGILVPEWAREKRNPKTALRHIAFAYTNLRKHDRRQNCFTYTHRTKQKKNF